MHWHVFENGLAWNWKYMGMEKRADGERRGGLCEKIIYSMLVPNYFIDFDIIFCFIVIISYF